MYAVHATTFDLILMSVLGLVGYALRKCEMPMAPLILGFGTGVLTMLLGIGGGFILVPAMIYLIGMATGVVVGTSLFQTLFVTAVATMVHATTTRAVDIVLAGLLLLGSVTGAQVGAKLATRVRPEYLRLALAVMVLIVGLRNQFSSGSHGQAGRHSQDERSGECGQPRYP